MLIFSSSPVVYLRTVRNGCYGYGLVNWQPMGRRFLTTSSSIRPSQFVQERSLPVNRLSSQLFHSRSINRYQPSISINQPARHRSRALFSSRATESEEQKSKPGSSKMLMLVAAFGVGALVSFAYYYREKTRRVMPIANVDTGNRLLYSEPPPVETIAKQVSTGHDFLNVELLVTTWRCAISSRARVAVRQPRGQERPGADAVPVPAVPVLQESQGLPRLLWPVVPYSGGEPGDQETAGLVVVQKSSRCCGKSQGGSPGQ